MASKKWHQEYYLKNKEKINQYSKKRYQEHKEEVKKRTRDYFKQHKVHYRNLKRKYVKNNFKKVQEALKQWKIKNKQHILEYQRNYRKKYRKILNNRIKFYYSTRIRMVLKGLSKSKRTLELLGCSIEFLKCYLASKFTLGMSWKNYNYRGWHIDHIKPCASFDLSKASEQRKCFNYMNLQPMWREDNQKKGSK